MPKYLFEDIKIKRQRKEIKPKEIREEITDSETKNTKNRSRFMLWFIALISVIFCFFAVSFLFSKAEVRVEPKTENITLDENLSASLDSNTGDLSFRVMTVKSEESKTIEATGEKEVAEKAVGTVLIFNAFSSSSQALNIDTRLEGSNGKIYKTQTKIVVPGISKTGAPGSVEVKIYGAEAGALYNSAPLDFKIFGFKGTPKYSKFYGRSKGEITGGFKGKTPAVSETEKMAAINDLKTALRAKLLQKATDHPDEFVLFKDAVFLNLDEANILSTNNQDNSLTLTLEGALSGVLLDKQKLIKKIAENNIDQYDGSEIYVSNIDNLNFSLADKDNISFEDVKNINFTLSGSAKIVWKLDEDKFIADLLGRSKKDFVQTLSQYPNINSATLTLSPLWTMSIPDKTEKVKVIVNYPK